MNDQTLLWRLMSRFKELLPQPRSNPNLQHIFAYSATLRKRPTVLRSPNQNSPKVPDIIKSHDNNPLFTTSSKLSVDIKKKLFNRITDSIIEHNTTDGEQKAVHKKENSRLTGNNQYSRNSLANDSKLIAKSMSQPSTNQPNKVGKTLSNNIKMRFLSKKKKPKNVLRGKAMSIHLKDPYLQRNRLSAPTEPLDETLTKAFFSRVCTCKYKREMQGSPTDLSRTLHLCGAKSHESLQEGSTNYQRYGMVEGEDSRPDRLARYLGDKNQCMIDSGKRGSRGFNIKKIASTFKSSGSFGGTFMKCNSCEQGDAGFFKCQTDGNTTTSMKKSVYNSRSDLARQRILKRRSGVETEEAQQNSSSERQLNQMRFQKQHQRFQLCGWVQEQEKDDFFVQKISESPLQIMHRS